MHMKPRQQQALLLALAEAMQGHGSWCGETHLQKATYFLKELCDLPLDFDFILYMHGPFSFDLRDELTAMRADGLLDMKFQPPPYGPSLAVSDSGMRLMQRWPKTLERHRGCVGSIANSLGPLGVAELERLATALYVTKRNPAKDPSTRAKVIRELKPHVTLEEAQHAVESVDRMDKELNGKPV